MPPATLARRAHGIDRRPAGPIAIGVGWNTGSSTGSSTDGRPPARRGPPPSGCPTAACRRSLSGCPPAAPAAESSSPTTADSRACTGCRQAGLELRNRLPIHPGRSLVRLHLLEGFPDLPLRDVERLCPGHAAPPVTGWPQAGLDTAAPSVQPHYRAFLPTTGCSAPVPRIGTLVLAGSTRSNVSLGIEATGSHVPHESLIRLHAAFKPDAARAGLQGSARADPRDDSTPGSDTVATISARSSAVRLRSSLRTTPDGIESRLFRNAHHGRS